MRNVVVLLALAACPRPRTEPPVEPPRPPGADVVPQLEIVAPARGTFVDGGTLVVRGHVRDDGAVRVTVNGVAATVASDGSFTAELAVPRGLTIVETHAIDATGHDVRDVRAVLGGPFAATDGSARASIGVRLGRAGLAALGKALAKSAAAIDVTAAAKAANPVYEKGGCLGVKVNVTELAVGKIEVALAPRAGVIETQVGVDDIVAKLDVRYEVACMGGSATTTVRMRARARGELGATLVDRKVKTSLRPAITLEDFQIDLGALPRPIEALLRTGVRAGVERALANLLERKVPPVADAKLAELLAVPLAGSALGRQLKIEIAPRTVELGASGMTVGADTTLVVAGGERGRYAAAPVTAGGSDSQHLGVWLAADAVNQLFAGLWAARAFERTLSIDEVGPLKLLLDGSVRTIELALALPPTVAADTALELAIGDLLITTRDAAGGEVQRFAVSVRSALRVKPDELVLATGEPVVHAQLLAQSAAIGRPLDQAAVEGIVKGAWALVDGQLGDALARVPLPGFAGLEARALTARGGLIVLDVAPKGP